ncbi:beta-lactamase-like protein, partial [Bipolaris maydis]
DHVHLGPGVSATRRTNPAIDIEELPHIDAILLSHYHEDHFDRLVEDKLSRDIPIITTPHAHSCLTNKGADSFTNVHALNFWDSLIVDVHPKTGTISTTPSLKITGMPGKHILGAVPPTNGWMIELGYSSPPSSSADDFASGYMVYITGDTLLVDELKEIPQRYEGMDIDLMLVHLGGTTIPDPGVELMHLINPDVTIPIHYDDYDLFMSPLDDFKKEVERRVLVKQEGEKKGIKDLPSVG